jgi:hypothetical protein
MLPANRTKKTGRASLLFRKVGACLLIAIITLAALELVLRLYHRIKPWPFFYDYSYNRWRGKPNAPDFNGFRLNSRGFKDLEFHVQKPPGCYRIVVLGDSFAFAAVPHHEAWLSILKRRLRDRGRYELINMGICGTGPKEYLDLLVAEGLQLAPDLVIVSFFIGNDFANAGASNTYYPHLFVMDFLSFFHRFYLKTEPLVVGQSNSQGSIYQDDESPDQCDDFLREETSSSKIFISAKDNGFYFRSAFSFLRATKRECDSNGSKLLVIACPDRIQLERDLQHEALAAFRSYRWPPLGKWTHLTAESFDFFLPNRLLGDELARMDIPFLDITYDFLERARETKLYRPCDGHWNIAGNQLAAESVWRFFCNNPWLLSSSSKPSSQPSK